MSEKYIDNIKRRIASYPKGFAFNVVDFTDLADYDTVKQSLVRLEQSGFIRRVLRGIYDRPAFSKLLQEDSAPEPLQVARALARRYNWSIAPAGETALNLMGISTQVPAAWSFVSSGPYKTYEIGNLRLEFMHRADKQISGMSATTALTIQALKAVGQGNLKPEIINRLRDRLSESEKRRLLQEGHVAAQWIFTGIKKICKGEADV
jgi:hypothetical protein